MGKIYTLVEGRTRIDKRVNVEATRAVYTLDLLPYERPCFDSSCRADDQDDDDDEWQI